MKKAPIIVSLGGSLIVPKSGIDVSFLKKFKAFIAKRVSGGERFVLICGGGATARQYQKAAKAVGHLSREDVDWIGIHSTRLNAHLLRTIFQKMAHMTVIKNPLAPPRFREPVLIAAGWKPGWSTDYCATLLASSLGATVVLNLSDIDHVYSADPRKDAKARPLDVISWKDFRRMVGNRWDPGANVPFDPVAASMAERLGLVVKMIEGHSFDEIGRALDGKAFKGTVIG